MTTFQARAETAEARYWHAIMMGASPRTIRRLWRKRCTTLETYRTSL